MVSARCLRKRQIGVTYMAVLLAVAMLGASLGAVGQVWRTAVQREKEQELLFIGNQYREAIRRYYANTPGPAKRYPKALSDLLADKRFPSTQRYLRRLYPDPITGTLDWGLLPGEDGGIAGVFSKSTAPPLKRTGFPARFASFENAFSYTDWQFAHDARLGLPGTPGTPGPGGPGGADPFAMPRGAPPGSPPTPQEPQGDTR